MQNQGKCKQSFKTNHNPNICVCQRAQRIRGRHWIREDINLGVRYCPRGTCFVLPLAEDLKGEGRSSGSGHTADSHPPFLHLSFYNLHFQQHRLSTYTQDSFCCRLVEHGGHMMWCPVIQMQNLPLDLSQSLSTFRTHLFPSCKRAHE